MNELITQSVKIGTMSDYAIDRVRALEEITSAMDQAEITTWHVLHSGMYSRTIKIPGGVLLTGVLVKVPTILVVNGDVAVYANEQEVRVTGYAAIPASANRKQAFYAHADTWLTMVFSTSATTVQEAEDEFTNEAHALMSRHEDAINYFNLTGE